MDLNSPMVSSLPGHTDKTLLTTASSLRRRMDNKRMDNNPHLRSLRNQPMDNQRMDSTSNSNPRRSRNKPRMDSSLVMDRLPPRE